MNGRQSIDKVASVSESLTIIYVLSSHTKTICDIGNRRMIDDKIKCDNTIAIVLVEEGDTDLICAFCVYVAINPHIFFAM